MAEKGVKRTAASDASITSLVERLAPLGPISARKMFGGHGVFIDGKMFALVDAAGGVFLKAGDADRARFEAAGAHRHERMPYYAPPAEVLADDAALREWAAESVAAARG